MTDFAEHLSRQHFARMHDRHIPAVSNSLTNNMSMLYERTTVKDIRESDPISLDTELA